MKKNSCTPINPKKYSCYDLKKIHTRKLIAKKNSCCSKIPHPPHNFYNGSSLNVSVRSRWNWNLEVLVFEERGKPDYPEKNLSEQGREPTTNSTHIWRRRRDLKPGHIGGRRVLSPLRHPCSLGLQTREKASMLADKTTHFFTEFESKKEFIS